MQVSCFYSHFIPHTKFFTHHHSELVKVGVEVRSFSAHLTGCTTTLGISNPATSGLSPTTCPHLLLQPTLTLSSCCPPSKHIPQGLCTYCSHCLKDSSPRFLLKHHLFREALPAKPPTVYILLLLPCCFFRAIMASF